jgi:VanZ family protein
MSEQRIESWLHPATLRWCAALLFLLMVLVGAIPGKAEALSAVVYDKLLHFVAYSLLSALICASLPGNRTGRSWRTLLAIAALGALDEGVQGLLPYREASLLDWQVDVLAALFTVTVMSVLQKQFHSR